MRIITTNATYSISIHCKTVVRPSPIIIFISSTFLFSIALTTIITFSPVSLGATVLAIALTVALIMGMISSGWFGLITFIIYIGGILVIFAYFAALQPNQHITSWASVTFPLVVTIRFLRLVSHAPLLNSSTRPAIYIMLTAPHSLIFVCLALLLFLALVAVVKISRANEGPLRPFYV